MRLLLPRVLPLVLAASVSVASARNIVLTEQQASDRHLSVQERTCADEHSAVVVSGSGSFQFIGHGLDFTAHVCAAEDGRGHRATGKVLNTQHVSENGHGLYHAHCAYVDKEHGFVYLGLEIEDMKSPGASTGEERKLAKSAKSAKATKSSKSSKSTPEPTDISTPEPTCRFRERGLEVISGNEPKGTLSIFRFEKDMDATTAANASAPSADRFAMSHHVAFDTTCEGFEDVVKTVQFTDEEVFDLTEGKFHIP